MSPQNEKTVIAEEDVSKAPARNQIYGYWDPEETIAIAGMAGKFPECENVEEFMENLYAGVDLIVHNDRRWPLGFCNIPGLGTMKDISRFDATYFGIPPKHAHCMDPQLRMVVELIHEAIIDAGMNPVEVRGSRTGVYYALSAADCDKYWSSSEDRAIGISMLGSCQSFFANRLSYLFDFTGPSFAMDSGCASSLIALNQAVTDMRTGHSDAAIVCASNLAINPFNSMQLFKLGVLSAEGKSKIFDERVCGYVRGEAVVVIYLRKKSQSRRVYADVVHVRNNTDGFKTSGLTFPSGEMQSVNNNSLYKEAGVDPNAVGYVEAHGTGTKVGDPEELNGIADVFCSNRQDTLLVGSLKSNMGHAEAAAGLCSIVKVLLSMHTGYIPPNLHYEVPNSAVPTLHNGKMKVVDKTMELPNDFVGINAFGLGGCNSHALLKRYNKTKSNVVCDEVPRLVVMCGRTELGVNYSLDKIENLPRDDNFVGLLHSIYSKNIPKHGYRGYTILNTDSPVRAVTQLGGDEKRPIWFVCTGWGAQWMGRTKELMQFEVFRQTIQACSNVLEVEGINLCNIINRGVEDIPEDFVSVFVTIGATQLALVDLLRSIGIEPDCLLGISTGELTCAYIDGTVTAEQVMQVAYHTARWAGGPNLPPATLAVVCGLTFDQVKALCPPEIVVAVHNDAKTCTVVGPEKQVPQFVNSLLSRGIVAKLLKTSAGVAFHSPHIAKQAEVLAHKIRELIPNSRRAEKHWISSSVAAHNGNIPLVKNFAAEYFMNIVTNTVLVQEALQHIPDNAIVVEVSPHSALQLTLNKVLPSSVLNVPLMSRDEPKQAEFMLSALGRMYNAGVQMNLANLYPKISFPVPRGTHMLGSLVTWDHSVEWTVPKVGFKIKKDGVRPTKCNVIVDLTLEKERFYKGHVVNQQQMFPRAGYLTVVWKGFAHVLEDWFENLSVKFENVEFHEHTLLPDAGTLKFSVRFPKQWDHSSEFELYEKNRLLASGFISVLQEDDDYEPQDSCETKDEPELLPLTAGDIYKDLRLRGYQYEGQFCSIVESDNRGVDAKVSWQNNWVTFLDSLIQFSQLGMDTREYCIPLRLKKLSINTRLHQQTVAIFSDGVPVKNMKDSNLIKTKSVKLQGLQFCIEPKTEDAQKEPELEKCVFIPYLNNEESMLGEITETARNNILTIMMQIVQENSCSVLTKNILEVAGTMDEDSLLAPVLVRLVNRLPMIRANVSVATHKPEVFQQSALLKSLDIKVEDMMHDSEYHLLVGYKNQVLPHASSLLNAGNFLLLQSDDKSESFLPGFSLVTSHSAGNIVYSLYRKATEVTDCVVIQVTSDKFDWLENLQTALKNSMFNGKNIVLVTQDDDQCGLLGLVTSLMYEPSGEYVSCVFVQDGNAPAFSLTHPLYAEQLSKGLRMNVYRNGQWGSLRHLPLGLQNTKEPVESAQVEVLKQGDLSTLSWVETPTKQKLQRNSDLCQVYYSSVSLTDALHISGELPVGVGQSLLPGQEFSGKLSTGQRVMGLVQSGALATQVQVIPSLLWEIPQHWSLEQAATVPLAYTTSLYALLTRTHIHAGDWVLIHSAASAVGQAAINICEHMGCHVIMTVRDEEEHEQLRPLFQRHQEAHVVPFHGVEDHVLALTGGRGVNVVFNTLQLGQDSRALASCLDNGGHFLDLGSSGQNNFGSWNITYHHIQLDLHSSFMQEIVQLMSTGLTTGLVKPLSARVYPESEMEQAFRFVSSNKYEGKVLVNIFADDNCTLIKQERKLLTAVPKTFFSADKVYVLAGGVGGFGIEVAHWLVQRGAKKLVLTSRRGVSVGYKSMQIRRWRDAGITVLTSTQDVTTEEGAMILLQKANKLGPIGGIFILTMVLRDGLLRNQTAHNFQEVCRAKADVTRSLDIVSQRLCPELKHFTVFSSVVCGRGSPGLCTYGMANSSMERICEARHLKGLPALAIQWGVIGDVGFLHNTKGKVDPIADTDPQNIKSCLVAFEKLLNQPNTVVTSHVLAQKRCQSNSEAVTEKDLLNTVTNILGISDLTSVNTSVGSDDFGIDSLTSTEIKNTLEDQFNVTLTPQQIYNLVASNTKEQAV